MKASRPRTAAPPFGLRRTALAPSLAAALAALAAATPAGARARPTPADPGPSVAAAVAVAAPNDDPRTPPVAPAPALPPGPAEADGPSAAPPAPISEDEEDDPALYEGWATPLAGAGPPAPRGEPVTLLVDLGAYYTSVGLYLPLTSGPTPDQGERGEAQLYWSLLRGALVPRFLVLEASVNPMPCLGLAAREWSGLYQASQVTSDLNLVRALTAGFDEPFALSLFLGNVADYDVRGREEVRGRGYLGAVVSGGLGHLKDDRLLDDRWLEAELKLKGDRVSSVQKLSWSFRAGVKLHDNPWITDTAYLGLRRGRTDLEGGPALLANSGLEYRTDLSLRGRPVRHLLLVDRRWPLGVGRAALVLGVGLLWESGRAYGGPLAGGAAERLQVLVRPNLVL